MKNIYILEAMNGANSSITVFTSFNKAVVVAEKLALAEGLEAGRKCPHKSALSSQYIQGWHGTVDTRSSLTITRETLNSDLAAGIGYVFGEKR